jgi:hypothetical protein
MGIKIRKCVSVLIIGGNDSRSLPNGFNFPTKLTMPNNVDKTTLQISSPLATCQFVNEMPYGYAIVRAMFSLR